jgi:acyl-CoA reductase-like NAD-dependent aldehyde dehydrogenase
MLRSRAGASNASPGPVHCEVEPLRRRDILAEMTRALEAALAKLATLPAEEQDRIARWLLDELRDDEDWARRFAGSQDALSKLAAEVRVDRAAGRVTELDPDKL